MASVKAACYLVSRGVDKEKLELMAGKVEKEGLWKSREGECAENKKTELQITSFFFFFVQHSLKFYSFFYILLSMSWILGEKSLVESLLVVRVSFSLNFFCSLANPRTVNPPRNLRVRKQTISAVGRTITHTQQQYGTLTHADQRELDDTLVEHT